MWKCHSDSFLIFFWVATVKTMRNSLIYKQTFLAYVSWDMRKRLGAFKGFEIFLFIIRKCQVPYFMHSLILLSVFQTTDKSIHIDEKQAAVFLPRDPLLSIDQDNKDGLKQRLPAIPTSHSHFSQHSLWAEGTLLSTCQVCYSLYTNI